MNVEGLIVDLFAGGGGASLGIEQALAEAGCDRHVDLAINHDPQAIACHRFNHPRTRHYCQDVFEVSPHEATGGTRVGLLWASPDCTHFSKAKGGKPRSKKNRSLAWVVIRWASEVRPDVIILENVEEFADWGPLLANGIPDKGRLGETFRCWVGALRRLGYAVEWRELRACDYGAPTIRKRLFVIARSDGLPIVWPAATHGGSLEPYRTAAECIDWSLPCHSIFLTSDEARAVGVRRPLAEATLRRIAQGIRRYVIDAADPFIVMCNHGGLEFRGQSVCDPAMTVTASRDAVGLVVPTMMHQQFGEAPCSSVTDPLRTITTQGNKFNLVTPYFIPRYSERERQSPRTRPVTAPWPTVTPRGNGASLVAAFLAKHYGGVVGTYLRTPTGTVTGRDHHALTAAHLVKLRGTCADGQDARNPMPTLTAGGNHIAEVRAFLVKYYGTAIGQSPVDPLHTITAKHRLGLVTVAGVDYQIVDIGMRMLTPRELARAQGFPDDYRLDVECDGRPLSKSAQVRLIGNSVPPPFARALVAANCLGGLATTEDVA